MLKLMVVDDEALHLMNLIGVIQVLKPSYIIFSAKDGAQALDIMRGFPVDLLITDIRMPNMDGIELIEKAKQLYPDLYTVVLTGFGEFEYAQRAIGLGVNSYMLKVVDQEELLRTLDTAEQKIRNRNEQDLNVRQQQMAMERLRQSQEEREIELFVLGYLRTAKAREVSERLGNFDSGIVLSVKYLEQSWSEETVNDWKNRIATILSGYGKAFSFSCAHRYGAPVTLLRLDSPPSEDLFEQLRLLSRLYMQEPFVLGISAFFPDLSKKIDIAFHQATEACEYVFYAPSEIVYRYEQATAMKPFLLGNVRLPLDTVRERLLDGEPQAAAQLLIQNAREYVSIHRPYPNKFKEVLLFGFWRIFGDIGNVVDPEEIHRLMNHVEQMISHSASMSELEHALEGVCVQFCDILSTRRKTSTTQALEDAAELLRTQYGHEWTLEELADRVHFNPSYFSSVFKQHFGVSYVNYLNDIRLKNAAERLHSTREPVGQLAQSLGYQNTTYFIKLFRRKYGITPNEYRRGRKT